MCFESNYSKYGDIFYVFLKKNIPYLRNVFYDKLFDLKKCYFEG